MHGCGSIFTLLVNAEVDSMGGVIDGGVGIGIKTSPRQAAIERAQADLRQEYDVREERRRELEFLEKGGNPLDFKFGNAASISVQSTSLTDHQAEQFVTSEAKGSFARTASPHGDSAESSGRPGAPTVCEPNTADNFDGENEFVGNERKNKKSGRSHNFQSEYSSQIEGTQSAKDSEDSALVRPYARRNRSRPNRESARSSSTDVVQSPSLHGSSAVGRVGSRDAKGLSSENIQKDYSASACNQKSKVENGDLVAQNEMSTTQSKMNVDAVKSVEPGAYQPKSAVLEDRLDATDSSVISVGKNNQLSNANIPKEPVETTTENVVGKVDASSADPEGLPSTATSNTEKETAFAVANGFADSKQDGFKFQNAGEASKTKGLDSESSCTQNSLRLDANKDIENGTSNGDEDGNENVMKETLEIEVANRTKADEMNNKTSGTKAFDIGNVADDDPNSLLENRSDNISAVKAEQDAQQFSQVQDGVKCSNVGVKNNLVGVDAEKNMGKTDDLSVDFNKKNASLGGAQGTMDLSTEKLLQPNSLLKNSSNVSHQQPSATRMEDKAREDSILEEARIIEAKRRRIAELSGKTVLIESRQKSSWDFVLEEMAWLANDFAQERLWKMTAAAQISHRIAFTSGLCFDKKNQQRQMKKVAYNLAKAVMQFWQSTELLLDDYDQEFMKCVSDGKHSVSSKEPSKGLRKENNGKSLERSIQGYAIRFLKCSKTQVSSFQAEAPATPEREADADMVDISWDDNLTEGSLFYRVPSGAMAAYRMSIESHLLQCEKTDINSQEEVDTSGYDAAAEEGETSTYYTHGIFTANKSSKHDQKKRKFPIKSNSAKHYEVGASLPYAYSAVESPQIVGIRPASNFSVGPALPKRVRTASRQKLVNPFGGVTGVLQASTKTDGSSGDTNSFQDDQIALNDGSQVQKGMEAESVANFEKLLPYDCTEASGRPKKKKPKHMVSAFEHGWHLDSTNHIEQRDTSKKRPDHQFDPNGTSGVFGQPAAKKLKVLKQFQENTYENVSPRSGSIPSPAASQMSNIPNTNKVIRFISGRERGRKHKSQKMSIAQPGSGSTWSTFEDQALVVLVHDLGPNWELVSDAMNSTLKFKCIYHNPKECKDRHKMLMDKGDGDDSAEDSGSSQPYPSTLPGIPKGNARQLFQHLQGPVEEDTLKSHFEKIIMIGKKQHYKRIQNDTLDSKQVAAVHNSHATALNSVWPNNLNGVVLTPLDLCDATVSSPDVISPVYQGSHTSGLVLPSQGAAASGVNSPISSTGMFVGNNLPSSSAPLNAPIRYNVQRTSADEQQQLQNGGQMLSRRNVMQQNFSAPGALSGPDRVRMQSGGNGMGTMPGMNRSMPALRPNLQSMVSSPALNSGNVLSSGMVGTPNHLRMPASGPSQGNPMMRSREALHMMQSGHNPENQRPITVPELQMQVAQGNSQGIPAINGLSSAFPNPTTPPLQTYPGHPQQQHQMSPQQSHVLSSSHHHHHLQGTNHGNPSQQQAYAMRIAKERQMQRLSQHQQQFATSNPLVPHAQPQSQHPISSPVQNNNLIQPQTSSQSLSMPQQLSSSTTPAISLQQQQKHNLTHHTLGRNSQTGSAGLASQTGKQRQRQPPPQQQQFQQTSRQHPQQRQHLQPTQQAKLMKGMGRGNMMVQQNLPTEHSNVNGFSTPPANQNVEKGEQIMHLMQSQGLGAGTGVSPVQVSKPLVSPHSSQPQQKLYPGMVSPSSKQMQQMSSHSDSSTLSHPGSAGHGLGGTNQAVSAASRVSNLQHPQPQLSQQAQLQPKAVSRVQPNIPRMHIQNHQANSDLQSKTQSDNSIQQPGGMVSLVGTNTIMPPACTAPANMQPVVSSAVSLASQRRPSENLYDSGLANPATQVGTSGSPSVSNSLGSETAVPVSQGHGQGQLSGGVPLNGNNTGTEWQSQSREQAQAQTQLQQSTTPPPSQPVMQSQEQQLQQEQQPPGQPQSQPSNLYIRPTNSKLG